MYVTTVRIPDELAEQVKVYCARTGASVNGALQVALERLVASPPATGTPFAGVPERLQPSGVTPSHLRASSSEVTPDWRGGKKP